MKLKVLYQLLQKHLDINPELEVVISTKLFHLKTNVKNFSEIDNLEVGMGDEKGKLFIKTTEDLFKI